MTSGFHSEADMIKQLESLRGAKLPTRWASPCRLARKAVDPLPGTSGSSSSELPRIACAQVFFCPLTVIVMQQAAAMSSLEGPPPHTMNCPFWAACALWRGGLGYVVLCKLLSGSG